MSTNPTLIEHAMPGARFVRVQGDHMEPTLTFRDYVAVVPTSGWHGDGLYLMDVFGEPVVYRAQNYIGSHFEIWGDRPGSVRSKLTRAEFFEGLLGVVAATVKVSHPALLEELARERGADA
jgi:hypothetical protein